MTTLALARSNDVPVRDGVKPPNLTRWIRPNFAGMDPSRLSGILAAVARGDLEDWADFCSHMLRIDAHLRAVYETRLKGVAGADIEILPGRGRDGEEELAEAGAEFALRSLETTPGLCDIFEHLLHGEGVGWAGMQHGWDFKRFPSEWHSTPKKIHPRDVAFADDWEMTVRDYSNGTNGEWKRVSDLPANLFLMHVPGGIGETPNQSGDLFAVAFPWVFKHWIELFRQEGLERFASPLLIGLYKDGSTDVARNAMLAGLENLSGDAVATMEALENGASPIVTIDASASAGQAHTDAITHLDEQMSKAILGSTLNTDVSSTGGNRALGESQFDTTILPRLKSDARRLADTIGAQWLTQLMQFNSHLWGGRVPPTPKLVFRLVNEDPPEIDELVINGGKVSVDELRTSRGLEPHGPDKGGDDTVQPVAAAPAFAREVPTEAAPKALRRTRKMSQRQMSLPLTSKTSRTFLRSQTQIASAPFGKSGDRKS